MLNPNIGKIPLKEKHRTKIIGWFIYLNRWQRNWRKVTVFVAPNWDL